MDHAIRSHVLTFKACSAAIADWWLKNVANATTWKGKRILIPQHIKNSRECQLWMHQLWVDRHNWGERKGEGAVPGWRGRCTWVGKSRSRGGGERGCESHAPSRRPGAPTRRACWCCSDHLVGTCSTDRRAAEPYAPSYSAAMVDAGEVCEDVDGGNRRWW